MPFTEESTTLIVDFIEGVQELRIRSIGNSAFARLNISIKISWNTIQEACDQYWTAVDDAIKAGKLTGGAPKLRAFYDEMVTMGVRLCEMIFRGDHRRQMWALCKTSSVMTIITDLMQVPWEALFDAESRSFLSDHCVVVRWPDTATAAERAPERVEFERERVICLDPMLANDGSLNIEGIQIHDFLHSHFGSDLILTRYKHELSDAVRSSRIVQWICEHAPEGLRIDEAIFYTVADSSAFPFADGSALILTSCRSAASTGGSTSVASAICLASHCTVIAPSSVVATEFGVRFSRTIDEALHDCSPDITVVELWRRILIPYSEVKADATRLTPASCFARWYGIYGNGQLVLKQGFCHAGDHH